ncbi:MAG: TolC family protein [Planctomycetota bacterium]
MRRLAPHRSALACHAVLLVASLSGCATAHRDYADLLDETKSPPLQDVMAPSARADRRPEEVEARLREELSEATVVAALVANSPRLFAAMRQWEAAVHRVPQAGTLPDPRFQWSYHGSEGAQTRTGRVRNTFQLSQTFPFFGKLALQEAVASKAAEVERERFLALARDLIRQTRKVVYQLYYVDRAVVITNETLGLVRRLEAVARSRYEANQASQHAVLLAQTETADLENDLVTLEDRRVTLQARLNTLLNRPPEAPLGPLVPLQPTQRTWELARLFELGLDRRQELHAARLEIEGGEARVDRARRDYLPDLTAGFFYGDVSGYGAIPVRGTNGEDQLGLTLGINLPLWLWKYSAGVDEASARLEAARRAEDAAKNEVLFEVREAHFHVLAQWRLVALYRDSQIPKAQLSLRVAETEYQAGRIGFLDFLDAERLLLRFRLAYERALSGYHEGIADLERAVGGTLEE